MDRELLINEPVHTLIRVLPNGDVRPTSFIWRDRTRYVNDVGRHWEEIVDGKRLHCYLIQAVDNTTYELQWDLPKTPGCCTAPGPPQGWPEMDRQPLSVLTGAQGRELERLMIRRYHISGPQLLENAGRAAAQLACDLLGGDGVNRDIVDRPVVVLAGRGLGGGGALVAARWLLNWGAWVQVVCVYPAASYRGAHGQQLAALQATGAALAWAEDGWELPPCDLLIDGVLGGAPLSTHGPERGLIALANSNPAPILSLDAPSGVDGEGGWLFTPHVGAAATLALALPKAGLRTAAAAAACGSLYLADISVPAALYAELGIDAPPHFGCNSILPLHVENNAIWIREK